MLNFVKYCLNSNFWNLRIYQMHVFCQFTNSKNSSSDSFGVAFGPGFPFIRRRP